MKRWMTAIGISVLLLLCFGVCGASADTKKTKTTPTPEPTPTPQTYGPIYISVSDEHEELHEDMFGTEIILSGTMCATGVMQYTPGTGREQEVTKREIEQILGWPDYDPETGEGALVLGKGGVIFLDFNAIIGDSSGSFLHIFMAEGDSDRIKVSVSNDMATWWPVSLKSRDFPGAGRYAEISGMTKPRYLRIVDNSTSGHGVAIDSVVLFGPQPLQPKTGSDAVKKKWYEKIGMTKKSATILAVTVGSVFGIILILCVIRRINIIRKKRKKRMIRVVYSKNDRK